MARPGFSQSMVQGTRMEQQLLPRMIQQIEVLQLPLADLEAFLTTAAEENEALQLEPRQPPQEYGRALPPGGGQEASDRHAAWLESQEAGGGGLVAALEPQLATAELTPDVQAWARLVVECLDPTGHLTLADERLLALAAERGLEGGAGELGRAIAAVQAFEPTGIGGRDTREALLLQLDPAWPDYDLLCRLIEEFLEDVARNKLPQVAKALDLELEELAELIGQLRGLNPYPGAGLGAESSPPVHPDVIVEAGESGFEVRVDQAGLPAVSIDDTVQGFAQDKQQPAAERTRRRRRRAPPCAARATLTAAPLATLTARLTTSSPPRATRSR